MADVKISGLPASTVPLAGTEVLPIVQSSTTKKVSIANVTAGRAVSALSFAPTGSALPVNGVFLPDTNAVGIATNSEERTRFFATGGVSIGNTVDPGATNLSVTGALSAASINKMAITAPATSSTLAVADGKTFTVSKTLTLTGTDATTQTFPTTSATIARTDAAQTFTGNQTFNSSVLGNGGLVTSANTAGAVMNITTAQNNGTTASPLYTDLNFKGYLDNIQMDIIIKQN